MNDYQISSGGTGETTIESGQSTVEVESRIYRENIPNWWTSHIESGGRSNMELEATGEFSKGPFSVNPSTSRTKTVHTEMMESFRSSLTNLEGSLPLDNLEIEDTSVQWGDVTSTRTEVIMTITVQNNMRVAPAPTADVSGTSTMGDTQLLNWESTQDSYRIAPGQSEEITINAYIDHNKIDDWFASHISNDETTDYVNKIYLSINDLGGNSPIVECTGTLKTDALVDNTRGITGRDCQTNPPDRSDLREAFNIGSGSDKTDDEVDHAEDEAEESINKAKEAVTGEGEDSGDSQDDKEETPNQDPRASATASPSSGEAPLTVTFDGTGSSDEDGVIERYFWRIEGATPGGEGPTIERTFRTQGEYDATLIVIDDSGARDRSTVTIDVERRSLR